MVDCKYAIFQLPFVPKAAQNYRIKFCGSRFKVSTPGIDLIGNSFIGKLGADFSGSNLTGSNLFSEGLDSTKSLQRKLWWCLFRTGCCLKIRLSKTSWNKSYFGTWDKDGSLTQLKSKQFSKIRLHVYNLWYPISKRSSPALFITTCGMGKASGKQLWFISILSQNGLWLAHKGVL